MSPANSKRLSSWFGWLVAAVLLAAAGFMWFERQYIVDSIQYYQYTPDSQVEAIAKRTGLTDKSKFIFYASHPVVEGKEAFNEHCERREATSPILGCYGGQRIYIYDITDDRLDGIKEVTAAHELLHAVYERLSSSEKERINVLLQDAYDNLADTELKERMAYYEENEPGEHFNELHSIIATEFTDIGSELNEYYEQYFTDRNAVVDLHTKVEKQFSELSQEAAGLVKKLNSLASKINADTEEYNNGVKLLNQRVAEFNSRAQQPGGFASQYEFSVARAELESERSRLEGLRTKVKSSIATHESLLAQLEAINTETKSLNASIDSVLSAEPEI